MSDELPLLDNFSGTARLFPLPNLVLYPQVMQPLHIFEPRYRQMTRDALDDDRLLALALLQPGWELEYEGKPAICPVVCLCQIIAEEQMSDGRYNLLVRGLRRARIITELETDRLYRLAEVELLKDIPCAGQQQKYFRQQFGKLIPAWFANHASARAQFEKLLTSDVPLGTLCDILCFTVPFTLEFRQHMLEEIDVAARCTALLERLQQKKDTSFPPDFSAN